MDEFYPEKNPFEPKTTGGDETGDMTEMNNFTSTSHRLGSEDVTNPYRDRTH